MDSLKLIKTGICCGKKLSQPIIGSLRQTLTKPKVISSSIFDPIYYGSNSVRPQQSQFHSVRDMLRYARERIVAALKSKKPYEYSVQGKKSTKNIIIEHKGTSESVVFDGFGRSEADIWMHGHPTGCLIRGKKAATPISIPDAFTLSETALAKQQIAFNEMGEYSLLKKKPDFIPLSKEKRRYYECLHFKLILENQPQMFNQIKSILSPYLPMEFKSVSSVKELFEYCKANRTLIEKIPKEKLETIQKLPIPINADTIFSIHRFWQKYADEMGFIYRTNYSCFKKQVG